MDALACLKGKEGEAFGNAPPAGGGRRMKASRLRLIARSIIMDDSRRGELEHIDRNNNTWRLASLVSSILTSPFTSNWILWLSTVLSIPKYSTPPFRAFFLLDGVDACSFHLAGLGWTRDVLSSLPPFSRRVI